MRHGIDQALTKATQATPYSRGDVDSSVSLRKALPAARFTTTGDILADSIAASVEQAKRGDLVVYRIGKDDPARLVAQAMARGAGGILTEQLLPCPVPQCIVGDIELAMAAIAAEQLGRPDQKLLTIGVIGSAGKTTTSLLLSTLLKSSGVRVGFQTDLGVNDGVVQTTAPESLISGSSLIQWLGDAADAGSQAAVMELSDELARYGHYDEIEFDMVVVTGSAIGAGDFGPSGLQCVLERLAADGVVIAPADDPRAMKLIEEQDVRTVTYGVRKAADVTAKIIDQSCGMTTLLVTYDDTTAVMETSLCGGAMAANHAAAVLVGLLLDQPLHEAVEKVSTLRSVPGRGQRLSRYGHASIVLDLGGTPDRVAASLRTFRSGKGAGRLWVIQAIDGGEQPEILARYGHLIERFADKAIVTSLPSSRENFLAASHAVLDGVEKCASMRLVADRTRAIQWAMNSSGPNDTILVITGDRYQTAMSARTDLQNLEAMIEKQWDKADAADPKPALKIVG
ncbi:MurE-like ligase [Rubripirellula lacrimiformis]|uniref:MurE-like ligase n=2 Tax=Rubripirellula lacrimiformis TaxID=1930273 RepID=A0A517NGR5_9BACT|nr:MurE-like ligase [Rubripirellula lacrimiformis]